MKLFKRLDVYFQIALFAGAAIQLGFFSGNIIHWYLIVGAWQLLSFGVHLAFTGSFYSGKGRRIYAYSVLFLIAALVVGIPWFLYMLYGLLFISPFYALFYLAVCMRENLSLEKKALIHLK